MDGVAQESNPPHIELSDGVVPCSEQHAIFAVSQGAYVYRVFYSILDRVLFELHSSNAMNA
jgi:hypothetical protein